jgi:hypothetical protein
MAVEDFRGQISGCRCATRVSAGFIRPMRFLLTKSRVGQRHLNATTENKVLFSEIDAQWRFSNLNIVAGNKRK